MLAKLRRRGLRISRSLAQGNRRAHDFDRTPGWVVIVHDVVVGEHLLVFG